MSRDASEERDLSPAGTPIVGRQWRSISVNEYMNRLALQVLDPGVVPLTERDRRLIGFVVESWLEDWWKKNSQG